MIKSYFRIVNDHRYIDAQGKFDYIVRVCSMEIDGQETMVIGASEEVIYLTKQQAMEFFDLRENA